MVEGIDQDGNSVEAPIINERALTIYLNGQEIVTAMTIGDYPDCLAVGYLLNQNMLTAEDVIRAIDHDEETATVVVRTDRRTDAKSAEAQREVGWSVHHRPEAEHDQGHGSDERHDGQQLRGQEVLQRHETAEGHTDHHG